MAQREETAQAPALDMLDRLTKAHTLTVSQPREYRGRLKRRMENTLYARMREWEVWVGKFQFDQWDAFVRRLPARTVRGGVADELVPGGPFPTRPAAGQAGIVYARTKI
jgi:hypothetical protein